MILVFTHDKHNIPWLSCFLLIFEAKFFPCVLFCTFFCQKILLFSVYHLLKIQSQTINSSLHKHYGSGSNKLLLCHNNEINYDHKSIYIVYEKVSNNLMIIPFISFAISYRGREKCTRSPIKVHTTIDYLPVWTCVLFAPEGSVSVWAWGYKTISSSKLVSIKTNLVWGHWDVIYYT